MGSNVDVSPKLRRVVSIITMNGSKESQGFNKVISNFQTSVFVVDIILNQIKGGIEK